MKRRHYFHAVIILKLAAQLGNPDFRIKQILRRRVSQHDNYFRTNDGNFPRQKRSAGVRFRQIGVRFPGGRQRLILPIKTSSRFIPIASIILFKAVRRDRQTGDLRRPHSRLALRRQTPNRSLYRLRCDDFCPSSQSDSACNCRCPDECLRAFRRIPAMFAYSPKSDWLRFSSAVVFCFGIVSSSARS